MGTKNKKISLIGAGNIGGMLANMIATKGLGDVVLLDVVDGVPQGKALDLSHSIFPASMKASITGTSKYEDIVGSDAIIVTAGIARKPGMSRSDLINTNAGIIKDVAEKIKKYAQNAFVIVVTNPLDVMVYVMHKVTGFNSSMVVGMAGVLDSARFCYLIADELKISVDSVSATVLGGHGDTMVPLLRYTTVAGIPMPEIVKMGLISQDKLNAIVQRVRDSGGEIVKLLGSGSAYYAPAASAVFMLESYLMNLRRVMPCAAYLNGKYGVKDMFIGVPVIIGSNGVERVIELELTENEKSEFEKSIASVRELVQSLNM